MNEDDWKKLFDGTGYENLDDFLSHLEKDELFDPQRRIYKTITKAFTLGYYAGMAHTPGHR